MATAPIQFESESVSFGDAVITLHKIKSTTRKDDVAVVHTHSYFELFLVTKGVYDCQLADETVRVKQGELLLIAPAQTHTSFCENGIALDIAVLGVSFTPSQRNGRLYTYLSTCFEKHTGKPIVLPKAVYNAFTAYYNAPESDSIRKLCERKKQACSLLCDLLNILGQGDPAYTESDTTDFDIMLETLVTSKDVPLSEIARRLGYSERQIQRKIRAKYGRSLRRLRGETNE